MIATGSKLQVLLICVGSAVQSSISMSSAAARAGTLAHEDELPAWVAGDSSGSELGEQLADVPLPKGIAIERAFAVDVSGAGRARHLHDQGDRDYSGVAEHEIAFTADVAGPGVVAELKTGQVWVDAIRHNAQILTAALAVWWHWARCRRPCWCKRAVRCAWSDGAWNRVC